MSSPIDRLPLWALDAILACARGLEAQDFIREAEQARKERPPESCGEQVWYGHFPMISRASARDLTPPETWSSINPKTLNDIFAPKGDLARIYPHYESRPGQLAMAKAVAEALNARRFLLAEAGTGVGKSLAYLVPCALWSLQNELPIVISTNTRNLQSQLLTKDLPLVRQIIARHMPPQTTFDAVVLKGRSNYLCLKRFGAFLEGDFERLKEPDALLFCDLIAWAALSPDGDLDTFRPIHSRGDMTFVRTFGCHADECTGKKCRFYRRCFLQKARQAALRAHLIIANHALVFAELSTPGSLFPPHGHIVFDEAHNLEHAATSFLSEELSPHTLYTFCQKIAPSRGREAGSVLNQIRVDLIDKSIQDKAEQIQVLDLLAELRSCGTQLAKAGTELFETFGEFMTKTPETSVRYHSIPDASKPLRENGQPQLRREVCLSGKLFISSEPFVKEVRIAEKRDVIKTQLHHAHTLLERLLLRIAQKEPQNNGSDSPFEDLTAAITAVMKGLDTFGQVLVQLLEGSDPNWVYWIERSAPNERTVRFTAAPLDIAQQLNNLLYKSKETLIFSSATLRVRGSFDYVRHRLGLHLVNAPKTIKAFVAESPFNYPEQCCVAVPDFLPEVITGKEYVLELSRLMYRLFVTAKGRSLVLFTSYDMLHNCVEILEPHLRAKQIELLIQSPEIGRDAITEAFRNQTRPTILFGTQSFWEGVDVVGDALSCVIIARLPFDSYGDPLFQARCEKIEKANRSPFTELTIPQAVIRFRQGFGRLIRSQEDHGIVVIADSRIVRRSYGTAFSASLPVKVEVFSSRQALLSRFQRLLSIKSTHNSVSLSSNKAYIESDSDPQRSCCPAAT